MTKNNIFTTAISLMPSNIIHRIALMSVVGSRCYGLEMPDSDYDIMAFIYPSYDDLFDGELNGCPNRIRVEDIDIQIADARKLFYLLKKPNPHTLEIFFSPYRYTVDKKLLTHIDKYREQYPLIDLEKLVRHTIAFAEGMKSKYEEKPKSVSTATRFLMIVDYYLDNMLNGIKDSYHTVLDMSESLNRDILMSIKYGEYKTEYVYKIVDDLIATVRKEYDRIIQQKIYAPSDKLPNNDSALELETYIRGYIHKEIKWFFG